MNLRRFFKILFLTLTSVLVTLWVIGYFIDHPYPYASRAKIVLPKPTGQFSVGTQALGNIDESRTMLRADIPRIMTGQTFYPAEPHGEFFPYMPETLKNGMIEGSQVFAHSKPGAKLAVNLAKECLIFYIPGRGDVRQSNTILCEELASHGYVVLAIELPFIANFVKLEVLSNIVPTMYDAWMIPRNRNYRYKVNTEVVANYIADINYVLKFMQDNFFKDLKTFQNVVLIGHSLGGNAAHIMGFEDPRIKAVIDLDSAYTDQPIYGECGPPPNKRSKPVLFLRGMLGYQRPDCVEKFSSIKKSTVYLNKVEHDAYTDIAFLADKIPNLKSPGVVKTFFKWFFKTGPHFFGGSNSTGATSVEAWYDWYRKCVLSWLEYHL